MTWSERQALAKKQAEEEEARSKASSFKSTPATTSTPKWKAPSAVGFGAGGGIATSVGVATLASKDEGEPEEEADWEAVSLFRGIRSESIETSLHSPPLRLLLHPQWRVAHPHHLSPNLNWNRNSRPRRHLRHHHPLRRPLLLKWPH